MPLLGCLPVTFGILKISQISEVIACCKMCFNGQNRRVYTIQYNTRVDWYYLPYLLFKFTLNYEASKTIVCSQLTLGFVFIFVEAEFSDRRLEVAKDRFQFPINTTEPWKPCLLGAITYKLSSHCTGPLLSAEFSVSCLAQQCKQRDH